MEHLAANIFTAIDTVFDAGTEEKQDGTELAKDWKRRNEIARPEYDGIPTDRYMNEGEVFDCSLSAQHPGSPKIDRCYSAIVSTGHCIRVEGSRSRIEVAAEVLSATTFPFSIASERYILCYESLSIFILRDSRADVSLEFDIFAVIFFVLLSLVSECLLRYIGRLCSARRSNARPELD